MALHDAQSALFLKREIGHAIATVMHRRSGAIGSCGEDIGQSPYLCGPDFWSQAGGLLAILKARVELTAIAISLHGRRLNSSLAAK